MLSITYSKKANSKSVRVVFSEKKISYFTGDKLIMGVGKKSDLSKRKRINIVRQCVVLAKKHKIKSIEVNFEDFALDGETVAANLEMANYEFNNYKTAPPEGWSSVDEVILLGVSPKEIKSIERGQIIGVQVNETRTLSNTPPGLMTPGLLAEKAKVASQDTKVHVKVLNKEDLKILKMGAILGVAQGSAEEPKFIIMEYWGAGIPAVGPLARKKRSDRSSDTIVLVGKGVTFDSGGLNLKPSDHIYEMHMDMSGGAAVIHAVVAAAKLGIKRNIVGLVPAVENMPSGSSYRPGDVLTTMSGQTIEVLNTDAEGRVILSDALTYAKQYNPKLVIDVATLTGAAQVALGDKASAIFSKDDELLKKIMQFGEESGDYVWPLPLWDEYEDDIKGTFGDWANIGKKRGSGGAIDGAIFLYQFIKKTSQEKGAETPWLHIDIAPRMTANEGENLSKGAAGAPVRLLIKIMENL